MGDTQRDPWEPWRRAMWHAGAPARAALVAGIKLYRLTLSGWLGGQCRFFPSCSEYALIAIGSRGALKGTALALWRVARCNPFGAGGPDPVPAGSAPRYDAVILVTSPDGRPSEGQA